MALRVAESPDEGDADRCRRASCPDSRRSSKTTTADHQRCRPIEAAQRWTAAGVSSRKWRRRERAHLDRLVVARVDAVDAEPKIKQDENRPLPWSLEWRSRARTSERRVQDLASVHRPVHVRHDAETSGTKLVRQGSDASSGQSQDTDEAKRTHLMAPAAVLGPNHSPTSLPSS